MPREKYAICILVRKPRGADFVTNFLAKAAREALNGAAPVGVKFMKRKVLGTRQPLEKPAV